MKKKVLLVLYIIFTLLTLVGAAYVVTSHGQHNAGYAVVPMIFAVVFGGAYKRAIGKHDIWR